MTCAPKLIRACTDTSVQDDPVRLLRAVRLAAALDFKIEASTRRAMKEAVSLLPGISAERQRDELFKILGGPRPDAAVRALEILGVFPFLLPELSALKGMRQPAPHAHDVWDHTLSVIHHLDGNPRSAGRGPRSRARKRPAHRTLDRQARSLPAADCDPLLESPQSGPKRAIAAFLCCPLP